MVVLFFMAAFRLNSFFDRISTQGETWTDIIPKEKKDFTILLMGYGGPGHEGAFLTDTMMVARIDLETNKVLLTSLPRDIWVSIPTSSGDPFNAKINSVYQTGLFQEKYPDVPQKYAGEQGAANLVKETVKGIIGQDVDYFLAIDFNGFKEAVDTLGGVDVNVERPFVDEQYPVTGMEEDLCGVSPDDLEKIEELENIATESPQLAYPCRYERLSFDAGTQYMDGTTALKFVRSRHSPSDGGDFNRAKRQQLFLQAVRDKVLSIGFIPKILPLMDDLEGDLRTDIPFEIMQKFLGEASQADEYTIQQIVLDTDNYLEHSVSDDRQYILIPQDGEGNWARLHKDIQNFIDGITPTPTLGPTVTGEAFRY